MMGPKNDNKIMANLQNELKQVKDELKKQIKINNNLLTKDLGLENISWEIDKIHRVGKPKVHDGVRQQNVIVKFKSRAARYRVYRAYTMRRRK